MSHASAKTRRTAIWVTIITVGHVLAAIVGYVEFFRVGTEHMKQAEAHNSGAPSAHETAKVEAQPTPFVQLLQKFRDEFKAIKTARLNKAGVDFKQVEETFALMAKLQPNNPNVWYFEVELARQKNPEFFDTYGCLTLPEGKTFDLTAQHQKFFDYLEATGPALEKLSNKSHFQDSCYRDESGACVQRAAWVSHLLANDYYQQALRASDEKLAFGLFKRAAERAKDAQKYKADNTAGFTQCINSVTLEVQARAKMEAVQPLVATGK